MQSDEAFADFAAVEWDLRLAVDATACILTTTIEFGALPASWQERAREKQHGPGDAVTVAAVAGAGGPESVTVISNGSVVNLSQLQPTPTPMRSGARVRALRQALADPSLSRGAGEWGKAEMSLLQHPEQGWLLAGDDISTADTPYGKEITATRTGGVSLLDAPWLDELGGPGIATLLAEVLRPGSAALVRNDRFDVYYVYGRVAGADAGIVMRQLNARWSRGAEQSEDALSTAAAAAAQPEHVADEVCWFCSSAPASAEDAAEALLYAPESVERSTEQVGITVQERIRYQQLRVKVPRCSGCFWKQGRSAGVLIVIGLGGAIAGAAAGYWLYNAVHWLPALGAFIAITAAVGFAAYRLSLMMLRGIRDEEYKLEYPAVKALLAEGYQPGTPPASQS